ncbi:cytochrome P450 [Frankia sp. CNm7]|uniref:Cytochrome P450 n=1 Tax=Frankia nepalensis TaxID=1836974 RepID=A0A937RV68_9ACTN|nr:cytochrome P450 [Frankia nepalensis]MBL7495254.1 cytochrome P450 [Frankia nepalensis]MBL7515813.1 cytochrome P450 [Frankia nepalensis]MBL7521419.1 cytochrome P450 [Frankia nepalensis]MBL7632471.1 cytochrome P450 [Frankia nepalensis]
MTDLTDLSTVNFFRDPEVAVDPWAYFNFLLADRPIWIEPKYGVAMVSGWEEALTVFRDPDTFSSCNLIAGPRPAFPVEIKGQGDDISELIEAHRDVLPQSDQLVTFDPPKHTAHRSLLMGLITPKRLKENEEFMWRLTDRQLDAILTMGTCEFINDFAQPYTLLVIADLLGVPEEDHQMLLQSTGIGVLPGDVGGKDLGHHTLDPLYDYFIERIEQRRANPQGDVLTGMAEATFPDGSTPDLLDVARIGANMFAAGQETTVRLLSACLQILGDNPELQQQLRDDRTLIPRFIEESLRLQGPIKSAFRLVRRSTSVGGVDLPAGTVVLLMNTASGRDPRQFENPDALWLERPNSRRHLAFGHGVHTCPGAPLARSEVRIVLERLFDRTSAIKISEEFHGPADARRYEYMPTYLFHGLMKLHVELTPVA